MKRNKTAALLLSLALTFGLLGGCASTGRPGNGRSGDGPGPDGGPPRPPPRKQRRLMLR